MILCIQLECSCMYVCMYECMYVCMDNFKYLRRLKRVEDLIDINKRSLYFAYVDFMNVIEQCTAYLYAGLCTSVCTLHYLLISLSPHPSGRCASLSQFLLEIHSGEIPAIL